MNHRRLPYVFLAVFVISSHADAAYNNTTCRNADGEIRVKFGGSPKVGTIESDLNLVSGPNEKSPGGRENMLAKVRIQKVDLLENRASNDEKEFESWDAYYSVQLTLLDPGTGKSIPSRDLMETENAWYVCHHDGYRKR